MRALLLLSLAAAAFGAEIPAGSHVLLRLQSGINSRTAKPGDSVYLQTATPITADGAILVPVGSYVRGVVAEVNRAGKVKGRAQLGIALESVMLANGQQFKFAARVASVEGDAGGQQVVDNESTIQQGPGVGRDVAQVAFLTGTGTWIGALSARGYRSGGSYGRGIGIGAGAGATVGLASVLLTRGRDVDLRQGSTLDVAFDQPVPLQ